MNFNSVAAQWQYLGEAPSASARFKVELADFIVVEELGFTASGDGDQLLLFIEKRDMSTVDALGLLARTCGVRQRDIGYCGLKDRRSISRQWFSMPVTQRLVPLAKRREHLEARLAQLDSPQLKILESVYNNRKLRRGSHAANQFQIRLRSVDGDRTDVEGRLRRVAATGFPNYFGEQRFGRQMSNLTQAVDLFTAGQEKPREERGKARRKGRGQGQSMLLSASRSFLFNEILSRRLLAGTWDSYLAGDVLNLAGTNRFFQLEESEQWDANYQQRLESFDIHPCGLLEGLVPARSRYQAQAESREVADGVRALYPVLCSGLANHGLEANYRPLRSKPGKLNWRFADNNLELSFSLESGQYATSLLREILLLKP